MKRFKFYSYNIFEVIYDLLGCICKKLRIIKTHEVLAATTALLHLINLGFLSCKSPIGTAKHLFSLSVKGKIGSGSKGSECQAILVESTPE